MRVAAMTETILAILANAVALASVVAALRTLQEMRRQRIVAYGPDLFISSASAFVAWTWNGAQKVAISDRLFSDADTIRSSKLPPCVTCHNLGAGPAKRIRASWRFDAAEFGRLASEHTDAKASLEIADHKIGVQTRGGRSLQTQVFLSQYRTTSLQFIMPTSGADGPAMTIPLPEQYLFLCAAILAAIGDRMVGGGANMPSLKLELTYEDREGNRHKREQRFEVTLLYPSLNLPLEVGLVGTIDLTSVEDRTLNTAA